MRTYPSFRNLKFLGLAIISLVFVFFMSRPLQASMPDLDINFLYEPKENSVAIVPDLSDLEQAHNAISDIPGNMHMRIPIPSPNPRETLVGEGTVNRSTGQTNAITAQGSRDMFQREAAIRLRNGMRNGFNFEGQSTLIADASNSALLAQYESCVYVDAYGNLQDGCVIDLVIRNTRTNQRWILPNVLVDKFCVYVMKAAVNRTWY